MCQKRVDFESTRSRVGLSAALPGAEPEQASDPPDARVRAKHRRSGTWLRELIGLRRIDEERDARRKDLVDLRRVDKPVATLRLDHDPVEDVLLGDVEHPANRADLHPVGRDHRSAALQDEERDQPVGQCQLTPKLVPQLQVLVAFGFLILNPRCMIVDS